MTGTLRALLLTLLVNALVPLAIAEPARDVQVSNLTAFARLYGYVRFFHPSDEAAAVDWNAFAVHGTDRVMALEDQAGLRPVLEELFAPLAPSLRLVPSGQEPPPAAPFAADLHPVFWQHSGIGLNEDSAYRSVRVNRLAEDDEIGGFLGQSLDARAYRGQRIRLRAAVRGTGDARISLGVYRQNRQEGLDEELPIRGVEWKVYEVEGTVDGDALFLSFGGGLEGDGQVFFDAFELAVQREETWEDITIDNPSFEDRNAEDRGTAGWNTSAEMYQYEVVGEAFDGEHAMALISKEGAASGQMFAKALPRDARLHKELGAGLAAALPLVLGSDGERTLPAASQEDAAGLRQALAALDLTARSDTDPAVHAAAVTISWNIFQHFYPYFDVVDVDWPAELSPRLRGALEATDADAQYDNLLRLVARLEDGHGSVIRRQDMATPGTVPWRLRRIEDRVVVTASAAPGIEPGDVIMSIDGESARELFKRALHLSSGSEQWRSVRALRRFGFGEIDTEAEIIVRRGTQEVSIVATRQGLRAERPREFDHEVIDDLGDGIFYVDLTRATITEIRARIDELAQASGVVFDLRGYPNRNHDIISHLIDEPVKSAHWIFPRLLRPDREDLTWYRAGRWHMEPKAPRLGSRPVFLTDGRAISYAESVMGIIEAYDLGEIVGEPTAGANGNVNPFETPGGYRFSWTGMRVEKHDDSQHHLVGILPTVEVKQTVAGVRAGRDEVLEKALEILRGRR